MSQIGHNDNTKSPWFIKMSHFTSVQIFLALNCLTTNNWIEYQPNAQLGHLHHCRKQNTLLFIYTSSGLMIDKAVVVAAARTFANSLTFTQNCLQASILNYPQKKCFCLYLCHFYMQAYVFCLPPLPSFTLLRVPQMPRYVFFSFCFI